MATSKPAGNKSADDLIQLRDLRAMFLPRWHWFAIALTFTLGITSFYLLLTPTVYTRSASLLIKDDQSSGRNSASSGVLADLDIFQSSSNINNELLILSSPILMTEVVRRLGLNEVFTVQRRLKRVELYDAAPYSVSRSGKLGKEDASLSFTITANSATDYTLTDFAPEGIALDGVKGVFGKSLRTSQGTITVQRTPHFSVAYVGKEVSYLRGSAEAFGNAYAGGVFAEQQDLKSSIVNISFADPSKKKSDNILRTLIDVYNESWIAEKNQIAVSTSRFINERLAMLERELGNVEDSISRYQSKHLLPSIQGMGERYLTELTETERSRFELDNQMAIAQYIKRELSGKRVDQPLPANTGLKDAGIETQIGSYNTAVIERNRLISNSSEDNPLVQDLTRALLSQQGVIIQSVDNLIASLNTQLASLQRKNSESQGELAGVPDRAKYLISVGRQQKVKETLYIYLLQKREENELTQAFTAYNTRLITAPHSAGVPSEPRKGILLTIAFLLGLVVPATVIFIKERSNTTVRGRKDLEGLSVPFLGEIPLYAKPRKRILGLPFTGALQRRKLQGEDKAIVVSEGNRNIINEAFRVLRSNLDFMTTGSDNGNVQVITSFNPGSGKSFLTMNLALSFAIKQKRILVIDGDLRHGSVSSYCNAPAKGLSDYLAGRTDDYRALLKPDAYYPTLHILPIGTIPPNPTELLETDRLTALVASVRSDYDYVFIDCPPIDIVADTQIIEQHSDRTIFVVRAGLLERSMLDELEGIYQEKRFKNLSVILNGTQASGTRYGSRYGYRYGYRYASAGYYHQNEKMGG